MIFAMLRYGLTDGRDEVNSPVCHFANVSAVIVFISRADDYR
jgi:hypothetical protein